MQLYDMHTHILPDFDDGADTIENGLSLLDCLKKQGVRNVCLTPHFYTHEMSIEDFISERAEAFEKFKPHIPDDMNIVLGTEVYITQYLFGNTDLSGITYGKSKYILVEFPYKSSFSGKTMEQIENLICLHGLIPVIPHVERYYTLTDYPEIIEELKDMGVIIQTNASKYTKKAPKLQRRRLIKLIESGLIDIIGTDAHSFNHNTPEEYSQALKYIADKCGQRTVDRMMEKAAMIFEEAL